MFFFFFFTAAACLCAATVQECEDEGTKTSVSKNTAAPLTMLGCLSEKKTKRKPNSFHPGTFRHSLLSLRSEWPAFPNRGRTLWHSERSPFKSSSFILSIGPFATLLAKWTSALASAALAGLRGHSRDERRTEPHQLGCRRMSE